MTRTSAPPAYAWDWFTRQRLLWREARTRLARVANPIASRYAAVGHKHEVVAMLRLDYPSSPLVRHVLHQVVAELVFLGRTDRPFDELGTRNPPRGLRWWWSSITGEHIGVHVSGVEHARRRRPPSEPEPVQPSLREVLQGYGDRD